MGGLGTDANGWMRCKCSGTSGGRLQSGRQNEAKLTVATGKQPRQKCRLNQVRAMQREIEDYGK